MIELPNGWRVGWRVEKVGDPELPNGWRVEKVASTRDYRVHNNAGDPVARIHYRHTQKLWVLTIFRIGIDSRILGPNWDNVQKNLQPTLAALIVRGEI
jgi:hypothetical protein